MDRNALDPGGIDDNDIYGRALARDPSNTDLQLAWLTELARRSQLEEANAHGAFRQAAPNLTAWMGRIPNALMGMRAGPMRLQEGQAKMYSKMHPEPWESPFKPGMSTQPLNPKTFRSSRMPDEMVIYPETLGLPAPRRALPEAANSNRDFYSIPGGRKD
jgi:hypothetical protein